MHARTDPKDFRPVEPDPLLREAAVPHEGEAARTHLEGAEPTDLRRLSHLALGLGSVLQTALGPKLVVQQQCTVEAVCKANWPAQRRSTEAERILERAGLDEDWVKCWPPFFTFATGNLNGMCGARSARSGRPDPKS